MKEKKSKTLDWHPHVYLLCPNRWSRVNSWKLVTENKFFHFRKHSSNLPVTPISCDIYKEKSKGRSLQTQKYPHPLKCLSFFSCLLPFSENTGKDGWVHRDRYVSSGNWLRGRGHVSSSQISRPRLLPWLLVSRWRHPRGNIVLPPYYWEIVP